MKKSSQAIKWEDLPEHVRKMNPHLAPEGAVVTPAPTSLQSGIVFVEGRLEPAKPVPKGKKQRARGPNGEKYRSELEREFHEWLKGLQYGYVEYEPMRLKLAERSHYTPDFVVRDRDGQMVCWETKGFWREAARVRIKVAARLFPWMDFIAVQKRKKKDGGGWAMEHIRSGEKEVRP